MKISTECKLTFVTIILIVVIYFLHSLVPEKENIEKKFLKEEISTYKSNILDLKNEIYKQSEKINRLIEENAKLREDNEELSKDRSQKLRISAYTASIDECDNDPHITANMTKVRAGIVAVSRDLFYGGWVFGKKIYIKGLGIYTIEDLMGKTRRIKGKDMSIKKSIDIFLGSKKEARKFGIKYRKVVLLN